MAIGPHWPDPAKKIIQFPHRPRAHTPLGEAVSPTNVGTTSAPSAAGRRAWRRHVNNCCGDSPCRRATSETTAPGTNVSSIIRALFAENRRRRPAPVITSNRRTVVGLGSSVGSSVDTSRSPIQMKRSAPSTRASLINKVRPQHRLLSFRSGRACACSPTTWLHTASPSIR